MTSNPVDKYADLQGYVMFIGYQQSGHSIVGSLLDAHPNAVVAHELHALEQWKRGVGRIELFDKIVSNTSKVAAAKRESYGYIYNVPGQWQGRHQAIHVIGDKQGGLSTGRLAVSGAVQKFRDYIGLPIRIIHVTRNPYDNIASMFMRLTMSQTEVFAAYYQLAAKVATIRDLLAPDELMEFRHEDFIQAPTEYLIKLCEFLGLHPQKAYLEGCSSIVKRTPSKKREQIEWDPHIKPRVSRLISSHPFLSSYSFDD